MKGNQRVSDGYTPIAGKCTWWRERPLDEDIWAYRLNEEQKRVTCSCFVEGYVWTVERADIPLDCERSRMCKYYIRHT
jgi:hypothetical protein